MTLEAVFRRSYGKLLAHLLSRGFDVVTAEDALSSALQLASTRWELHPPENPEAWLVSVAARRAIDQKRRVARNQPLDWALDLPTEETLPELQSIEDERLRLFFLCTHPAIDSSIQTPLMLQLLLGFSAAEIAEAYVKSEAQVAQRLVRAKRKIRDANILPNLPEPDQFATRATTVLEAIYALYGRGWEHPGDEERISAAREARELAQLLTQLLPDLPEVRGLYSLILFCEARRSARLTADGTFIALDDQEVSHWDFETLRAAESQLQSAVGFASPGRFQLEAAIQSAHLGRLTLGVPDWSTILRLYDGLVQVAPTLSNEIGRIAVLAKVAGPEIALIKLDAIRLSTDYQPWFALRCHLCRELGDSAGAIEAAHRAYELATDPAIRAHYSEVIATISSKNN